MQRFAVKRQVAPNNGLRPCCVGRAWLAVSILTVGCASFTRTPTECDYPPSDTPRGAVRRATLQDAALLASGRAGLVMWVGGRTLTSGGPSQALVRVVGPLDTLSLQTSLAGVGSPAALRAGFVTISVRRLGYVRSRDTVTLRMGYVDTVGVGLWQYPNCLGRVTIGA
jgi:hypothetical protein